MCRYIFMCVYIFVSIYMRVCVFLLIVGLVDWGYKWFFKFFNFCSYLWINKWKECGLYKVKRIRYNCGFGLLVNDLLLRA